MQVSLSAVLVRLCAIPDVLRLRVAASGADLAGLQHRYDLPAVVEVAAVVLELACAACAVVGGAAHLSLLLVDLDDLRLLLLDGRVGSGVEALLHVAAEVRRIV